MLDLSSVLEFFTEEGITVSSLSLSTEGDITVHYASPPTEETLLDVAALLAAAPWLLQEAKTNKMKSLDLWYSNKVASGITVSGITFESTIEAQNRFDAIVTMILAAISVGAATSSTPFTIYDISGTAITVPASSLMGLMLQYGQTAAVFAGQYSAFHVAVNQATTIGQVEAIPLPD